MTGPLAQSQADEIAMETYVLLMLVKQRTRWGYEPPVWEVCASLHLRRFCLIGLGERVRTSRR